MSDLQPHLRRPGVILRDLIHTPKKINAWRELLGKFRIGVVLLKRSADLRASYTLSPLIGFHCRHLPTCSDYAEQSLVRFGLWAGGWMTLARLCRCQPWGTSGLDFIPERAAPDASWYRPWRYGRWRGTNPDIPAAGAAGEPAPSSQA
jgi:putative membrane protein insertion efficiency factor